MKFNTEMFILPDGSPMDPSEIAEMLNEWKSETPDLKRGSIPSKWKISYYQEVAYRIPAPPAFDSPYEFALSPRETTERMSIPIYEYNFLEEIQKMAYVHGMEMVELHHIVVGYDVFHNLRKQMSEIVQYGISSERTPKTGSIEVMTQVGPVLVLCSNSYQELKPIYMDLTLKMMTYG